MRDIIIVTCQRIRIKFGMEYKMYWGKKKGVKNHKYARKIRKGKRPAGILWDYDGDGRFSSERIKGKDKLHWKRYWRRKGKDMIEEQINE